MAVVPEAEQCISYGTPAFKLQGKTVAGFAAFQNHLSYLPHSGSVRATLPDDVAPYETSKGSLKFAINKPLPKRLVKKLVHARMQDLGLEWIPTPTHRLLTRSAAWGCVSRSCPPCVPPRAGPGCRRPRPISICRSAWVTAPPTPRPFVATCGSPTSRRRRRGLTRRWLFAARDPTRSAWRHQIWLRLVLVRRKS
jgi:hypothetical protein